MTRKKEPRNPWVYAAPTIRDLLGVEGVG